MMNNVRYKTHKKWLGEYCAKSGCSVGLARNGLLLCLLVLALLLTTLLPAHAQQYPAKPITLVVGMPPGGITDLVSRVMAEEAKKMLKQEVLVASKPGASQTVAMSYVISAAPDGYTLGSTTDTPILRAPHMMTLSFNPLADTSPILFYGTFRSIVIVPADSPFKTLKDMLDFTAKNPTKLTYGSPGLGTTAYLGMAGMALQKGLKVSFVPFAGDAAVLTAVLGGHIMAGSLGIGSCISQIKAGKVRVIGIVEGEDRLDMFPQAQTLHELGMQDALPAPGFVIFGQKNLPAPIVKKLEETFVKAADSPAFKKFAQENDIYAVKKGGTGTDLQKVLKIGYEKTGILMRALGLDKTKAH
jgi:tripartite-type tricarboxylate transporter receptor subunit TctC